MRLHLCTIINCGVEEQHQITPFRPSHFKNYSHFWVAFLVFYKCENINLKLKHSLVNAIS